MTVPVVPLWAAMLGREVLGLLIALTVLRWVILYAQLRTVFGQLAHDSPDLRARDDASLLALDRELQHGPVRSMVRFALGWLAMFAVAVALMLLGVPIRPAVGSAEYLMATLLLLAVVLGAGAVILALLDAILLEARIAIGDESCSTYSRSSPRQPTASPEAPS